MLVGDLICNAHCLLRYPRQPTLPNQGPNAGNCCQHMNLRRLSDITSHRPIPLLYL